jgi:hypothetical protein
MRHDLVSAMTPLLTLALGNGLSFRVRLRTYGMEVMGWNACPAATAPSGRERGGGEV